MYRNSRNPNQTELQFVAFESPFSKQLRADNRWVRLSRLIPWSEYEVMYQDNFGMTGNPAKPFRIALGSLIIKERLGLTDEETVEQIRENPYLQYFIGFMKYRDDAPFNASSMVHFRKRITLEMLQKVNEQMCGAAKENVCSEETVDKDTGTPAGGSSGKEVTSEPSNISDESNKETLQGKLIIDATCAPEDMRYPTDVGILNEARELTETVIDALWESVIHETGKRKPRTYRRKARLSYLMFIRQRRPSRRKIRKAIRRQLGYVRRNLSTIEALSETLSLSVLSDALYRKLLVVSEVYRQQSILLAQDISKEERRISDRIVSICKPHVRPIVRGKASAETEFGSKLSISVIDGKAYLDRLSWDAYHEGGDLPEQAESYKGRTGYYPTSIHADKAYRSRENLSWCQARGIRLSGPMLGRPPKNSEIHKAIQKQQRQDECDRNAVEGVFGRGKRKFSLSRIMTKLKKTSEHAVAMVFLVMNMETILRDLFLRLWNYLISAVNSEQTEFIPSYSCAN